MPISGRSSIRAAFADAEAELARARLGIADPPAGDVRAFDGQDIGPGQWAGAPADCLPPGCPVTPLGVDGKTTFFVDSLGQLISMQAGEWSKKSLLQLFALQPNYLYWAWPRWGAPKAGRPSAINGLEVDDAAQCLMKAAAQRGLFSPMDRVRGRGAWTTKSGQLLWHSGEYLWMVEGRRMKCAKPGEVDGVFYPQRPPVTAPWREPVPPSESPAHELLAALRTWTWERPVLDPLLVLGWIGCSFLGGALPWRPHIFAVGDRGVGKSTLQQVIKAIVGDALHACAETTAAGVYQRVGQDSLPVAIDELEASADNRKVMAVVSLARLASSGALMYRGGAEHQGVEFRLMNAFVFSSINPPPLEPQDRSRMAVVNLGRLDPGKIARSPVLDGASAGRMILRSLMDGWPDFERLLGNWRDALRHGGLDSRGQDTFGTLLAVANMLLGDAGIEEAGLPVMDEHALGELVAQLTAHERSEASDNWRLCFERLMGFTIEAWKGGEKPTIGHVVEQWEAGDISLDAANERLRLVDLALRAESADGYALRSDGLNPDHAEKVLLAIPLAGVGVEKVFAGTKWAGGVWGSALKQAADDVVIRTRGNGQNVKINRVVRRCLFVDMRRFDDVTDVEAE